MCLVCARAKLEQHHQELVTLQVRKLVFEGLVLVRVLEGSVNVMGRKGGNRLFPTLTLTLTFHHPEQSLLHKLHWLDHVIRVGVLLARALLTLVTNPRSISI